MSALTDLFQSMANKIRSKTGTATTYTPPQMVADGIDDVFDAGVASATTPITPSDSSPVAMSANTGYKPTRGGYAIESNPTSITPSNSSPATITSGVIYSAQGTGKAVSVITDITPSATSPTVVAADDIVKMGDAGFVCKLIPITPNNSNPAGLNAGYAYLISGQSGIVGYAIASSPESKTPSDTSPAAVTSGSIIKPSANGYLYKTQQTKSVTLLGSIAIADTSTHTVTLSKSVKNYRYLLCCMTEWDSTNGLVNMGLALQGLILIDTAQYVSGWSAVGNYASGSNGSYSQQKTTYSYNTNSNINIKNSSTQSRTVYIYGIN